MPLPIEAVRPARPPCSRKLLHAFRLSMIGLWVGCAAPASSPSADGGAPTKTNRWLSGAPLPGGPRQEVGVAAIDDQIFVVGGLDEQGGSLARVEIFDPRSGAWRNGADAPIRFHHPNVAAADGRLWVVGALGDEFRALGDVLAYDPATDRWDQRTAMPTGSERGAGAAVTLADRIVVVGGYRGSALGEVSSYDFRSDAWSSLPPLPTKRDHLVAGAVQGVVYAIGGRDGGHTSRVDALVGDSWQSRQPMPTSRAGSAAAVVDESIYVFGGEGEGAPERGVFDQVESYDPSRDAWTSHSAMRSPRHGIGAGVVGGVVWIPGGADVQGFAAVASNEGFVARE